MSTFLFWNFVIQIISFVLGHIFMKILNLFYLFCKSTEQEADQLTDRATCLWIQSLRSIVFYSCLIDSYKVTLRDM